MSDETSTHHPQKLYAAFLYGKNIPGREYLTGELVQNILRPLASQIAFVKIVSRPDSFLVLCKSSATEQSIVEAIRTRFVKKCVVIEVGVLRRIVQSAQNAVRSIEQSAEPPYRLMTDGGEWEWRVVMCSEQLPASVSNDPSPFPPTTRVVPVRVLESHWYENAEQTKLEREL